MFILPICKDDPVSGIPWVVFILIAVKTIALGITYIFYTSEVVFRQYGFIPSQPSLLTVFSSMFLHSGLWHLLGNMCFLWMFGNRVENMLTSWLFLPAYLNLNSAT